jgi:hypothetical protein
VQDLLLIRPNVGVLKIGGENFGKFVPSGHHCVQLVQSDVINFHDGMVSRLSMKFRAWKKIKG